MKKATTSINALASVSSISEMKEVACEEVKKSFESFCLMASVDSLMKMFEEDAEEICGPRYGRGFGKRGHRWGTTRGKVGFHGRHLSREIRRLGQFVPVEILCGKAGSVGNFLGRRIMCLGPA